MKKQTWLILFVVILLIGVYLYRAQLTSYFKGSPTMLVTEPNPTPALDGNSIVLSLINNNATKGDYLADPNGMTLYSFDKDTNGVSNCYDTCVKNWPIYTLDTMPTLLPTNWSIISRTDGTKQFAYKGMPLYFYIKDTKPEDITGDGVGGIWHLVKP